MCLLSVYKWSCIRISKLSLWIWCPSLCEPVCVSLSLDYVFSALQYSQTLVYKMPVRWSTPLRSPHFDMFSLSVERLSSICTAGVSLGICYLCLCGPICKSLGRNYMNEAHTISIKQLCTWYQFWGIFHNSHRTTRCFRCKLRGGAVFVQTVYPWEHVLRVYIIQYACLWVEIIWMEHPSQPSNNWC
jgi:hypothetical protein